MLRRSLFNLVQRLPTPVFRVIDTLANVFVLYRTPSEPVAADRFGQWPQRGVALDESATEICTDLQQIAEQSGIGYVDVGRSVERKLMAQLIRQLRPRRVLEVGTYLGWTSVTLGLLLKQIHGDADFHLTSVDIADVDSPEEGCWHKLGHTHSPTMLLQQAGLAGNVELVRAPSADYLAMTDKAFDFVFIDGHHGADSAYRDIALASQRLEANGIIAMHDYDPPAVWLHKPFMAGPYLAARRITKTNPALRLIDTRLDQEGEAVRSSCIAILAAK